MRCDTVWIDTDRAMVTLTWRGLTEVGTSDESALGPVVVAAETKGKELRFKHIERLMRAGASGTLEGFDEEDPLNVRYDGTRPRASDLPPGAPPPSGRE